MVLHSPFRPEPLITNLAKEWPRALMDQHVDSQVGFLTKSFLAALIITSVWLCAVMPMHVSLKSVLPLEAFFAACKRAGMLPLHSNLTSFTRLLLTLVFFVRVILQG